MASKHWVVRAVLSLEESLTPVPHERSNWGQLRFSGQGRWPRFKFGQFCKPWVCIYSQVQTGHAEAAVHRYMYKIRDSSSY